MKPRVYLAGPDVFLPNAFDIAQKQRELCIAYSFEPLHPFDNEVDLTQKAEAMHAIYRGNVAQIERCHIVIANCNFFRGGCIDDGTAYELGYANALKKPTYGYIERLMSLEDRMPLYYPCFKTGAGRVIDKDGFLVENFGGSINLMMQCGMYCNRGALLEGNLETCLKQIGKDLKQGVIKF